ncbi:hypothetical protein LZZ85_20635 [Terrimonas sp. NA20]|uniref:Uncharacterized protein n=1 Tax=Terrimonas ginsenosidimutans TaxID=2908004 RepID=A0ABS9KWM2_9BACT|nr:hypothetical protein [Terrimonas ginsenosidimutans]MCG2616718.1 hypothetical protein [Terrimonas ginsenosidimutans]
MSYWGYLFSALGYLALSLLISVFLGTRFSSKLFTVKIKAVLGSFLRVFIVLFAAVLYLDMEFLNGLIMFVGLFSFYAFVLFLRDDTRYLTEVENTGEITRLHFLTPFAVSRYVDIETRQVAEMIMRKERSLNYYPIVIRIRYKAESIEFMIIDRKLRERLEGRLAHLETLVQAGKV